MIAFWSRAANLVDGDTNGVTDIFVHDRVSAATIRVSVASGGGQSNGISDHADVSADGRFVAFRSAATNLVTPAPATSEFRIYIHDRLNSETRLVSVGLDGQPALQPAFFPRVSGDGRLVVFVSHANNLVTLDTNMVPDVFVRDLQLGTTVRASVGSDGSQALAATYPAAISGDGRFVAFENLSYDLTGVGSLPGYFVFDLAGSFFLPGDANCDGDISVGDIAAFVLALIDPAGYAAQFPECDIQLADANCDGAISVGDIGPFVDLLVGP
jgi:Tol biopolymer transport system component